MPTLHGESTAGQTRRDFLKLGASGIAAATGVVLSGDSHADVDRARHDVRLAVLDDCDPQYKGRDSYRDNLSLFDGAGKLLERITGLNICEEIGSPHRLVIDGAANRIWSAETVGGRLLQYDLRGKEILALPDLKACALAIDPASHHLWVARSGGGIGQGITEVYDPTGKKVAAYDIHGYDLIYDAHGKAFWLVDRSLVKLSPAGQVLVNRPITEWCAISLAADQKTGRIWAATREHENVAGSKNALLGFDTNGHLLVTVDLGNRGPFRIAVDPTDGAVWCALWNRATVICSPEGKLVHELPIAAISLEMEMQTSNCWVATQEEILKISRKGDILARANHHGKTTQAWLASR